jgi:hypothetical protein
VFVYATVLPVDVVDDMANKLQRKGS